MSGPYRASKSLSFVEHPQDLVLGYYSVHMRPEVLEKAEANIARIGCQLSAAGRVRGGTIQRRYLRVRRAVLNWPSNSAFNGDTAGAGGLPWLRRRNWYFTTAMVASEATALFFQRMGGISGLGSPSAFQRFGSSGWIASAVPMPATATPLSNIC